MVKCCVCDVHICADCIGFRSRYINGVCCKWCYLSILNESNWFCLDCGKYFKYDNFVLGRYTCKECYANDIAKRLLLPHRKARPIIETYYIPDIAKIIYDYYYVPRRYFKGEE